MKIFHIFNDDPNKYACGKSKRVVSTDQDYITTDPDKVTCKGCKAL